jgi:hypothetical protein
VSMCKQGVLIDTVICCSFINAMDRARQWALAVVVFSSLCHSDPLLEPLIPPSLGHSDELSDVEIDLAHKVQECLCMPQPELHGSSEDGSPIAYSKDLLCDLVKRPDDKSFFPEKVAFFLELSMLPDVFVELQKATLLCAVPFAKKG